MYIDDPSDLFAPVEAAWIEYTANGTALFRATESEITEWRFADDLLIPDHPLSHLYYVGDYSPWYPRPWQYREEDPNEPLVRHGFDADGRLRIVGNRIIFHGDGYYDLLMYRLQRGKTTREPTGEVMLYEPHYSSGFPQGRVTRFCTDDAGRITLSLMLSIEGEEPQRQYRVPESFQWTAGKVCTSFRQHFTGKPHDEQAPDPRLREVNDELQEPMYMRTKTVYSYNTNGILTEVATFDGDGKPGEVWYSRNPKDTIASVSKKLVRLLSRHVSKAIKSSRQSHPVRYAVLLYSAEHAHCGLPHRILLAPAGQTINPLDREAYVEAANWPPEGRTERKLSDLLRRLMLVVESAPEYAEDFQPRPYREVLWSVCRSVYARMARRKYCDTDFAIFPLDDHGDADSLEDVRQSLPDNVAEQVLNAAENDAGGDT